ncbi:MAG: NUDIX domain-containing protein [Patescibacteria group bacterium]
MSEICPKVGIGCLVMKDGRVLLGKRLSKLAPGVYGGVGGHLENMESVEEALRREVREEAGIELGELKFLCAINYREYEPNHYIGLGFVAELKSGEPQNMEPDKCEGWDWYDLDNLPEPMLGATALYVKALQTGQTFFDE